jgi:hypothetical protein
MKKKSKLTYWDGNNNQKRLDYRYMSSYSRRRLPNDYIFSLLIEKILFRVLATSSNIHNYYFLNG